MTRSLSRSERLAVRTAAAVGLFAYGWWATGREPFTVVAAVAVLGAGLGAMVLGQRRRSTLEVRPGLTGAGLWLVLLGALAAWQQLAYLQAPRSDHPTLSSLANAALDTHPARALALVAWLAGGYRLARR